MLARDESEPCGDLAPIAKVMPIAQRSYQRRCVQRPDPLHFLQALTRVEVAADAREPLRHRGYGGINCAQLLRQALEQIAQGEREAILGIFQDARQAFAQAREALRDHDTIFQEQASDLIFQT